MPVHTTKPTARVVLDSWVVSQIWLDSDSNESSQSRVGRENQGYESSQSRVTLIVIWVRVESTGYCLIQTWVNDFSRRKRQDLAVICNFTEKVPTYSYIRPQPPPPPLNNFSQIRQNVMSRESDLTQLWLKWVESECWVRLVNLGFGLSRSWVRLANLGFELSRNWVTWIVIWVRVESARKNESSTTLLTAEPAASAAEPQRVGRADETQSGGRACRRKTASPRLRLSTKLCDRTGKRMYRIYNVTLLTGFEGYKLGRSLMSCLPTKHSTFSWNVPFFHSSWLSIFPSQSLAKALN